MKEINYPRFDFDSELSRAVISLERVRAELDYGSTPPVVFFQLEELFELLTSIMSARIEGNRTSLLDAVEHASDGPLTHLFIRELHRMVADGLRREGDRTPGAYRLGEITIGQAEHRPPFPSDVLSDMTKRLDFANEDVEPHKQLLQCAIVHHRLSPSRGDPISAR